MTSAPKLSPDMLRLVQSIADLEMCNSALQFMSEWDEDQTVIHKRRKFRCFEDAAVMAYCRPFSRANGLQRMTFEAISLVPTEAELDLHKKLLERRDKVIAHSDVDRMRLSLSTLSISVGEFVLPHLAWDDGLQLYDDRTAVSGWVRRLISACANLLFENAQELGAGKIRIDHLFREGDDQRQI